MSKTKRAAGWFVCVLLAVLTAGGARAGWSDLGHSPIVIVSVKFTGAEHFSAADLQPHLNLSASMTFDPKKAAEDCATIMRHYQEHGYPFVTCTHSLQNTKGAASELLYTINEGPKVKVERVEFLGNNFVGGDVLAEQIQSHKRGSTRTNFALIHDDVLRLTDYYRSFGYLDATVSYELQWNLDGGAAVMMFHITEGERYKVEVERD